MKKIKQSRGRRVEPKTVMFDRAGTIRISHDLIPPHLYSKKIAFVVGVKPFAKSGGEVTLIPIEQSGAKKISSDGYVVRAWFPSKTSKSPLASASSILSSLSMSKPEKKKVYPAEMVKLKSGMWAIRFSVSSD